MPSMLKVSVEISSDGLQRAQRHLFFSIPRTAWGVLPKVRWNV